MSAPIIPKLIMLTLCLLFLKHIIVLRPKPGCNKTLILFLHIEAKTVAILWICMFSELMRVFFFVFALGYGLAASCCMS